MDMDKHVSKAGKALDDIDSPKVTQSIKTTQKNTESLGRATEVTSKKVTKATSDMGTGFEKMAAKGTASIQELTTALRKFEHERATAKLDVDIASAEAKIRLLKHEIRTFSTRQAQSELEGLGLVATAATTALAGAAGGGGGGPGGLRGGLAGGFFAAGGRAAFMAAAFLAALPAIVAFTGAISALVGSLSLAVAGAGAVGIGMFGAAAVGIGAIAAAAIPASKAIGEAKKAQDAYNKSIEQFGRDSAQAAKAKTAMDKAFKKAPGGTKTLLGNVSALGAAWKQQSRPGQEDFVGILNDSIRHAMRLLPTFSKTVNGVMASTRQAVQDFFAIGRTPEVRGIIRDLGATFSKSIGPFMRAFGQFALFMGRVSRAVSPMVVEFFKNLEGWMTGWANAAKKQNAVQDRVRRWVEHLKSWAHLLKSTGKLMAAFFGAGAEQGKSIVEAVADQFDRWTEWLKDNPGAVQNFFSRTIESAGKLVSALGEIASVLARIGDAMLPILNAFSDLTSLAGGSGLLGPLALLGGARMALGKGFGGILGGKGGKGAAAGGLTGGDPLKGGGSKAGGLLRGAGRIAAPLAAGMAAFDFATTRGGIDQRIQGALSGASLGILPGPTTDDDRISNGQNAAAQFLSRGQSTSAIQSRIAALEKSSTSMNGAPRWSKGYQKQIQAQIDTLRPVLKVQIETEQKDKAMRQVDELMAAFDSRWAKSGSKAAQTGLIQGIRRQINKLGPDGDRQLLKATASWTHTMENGSKAQQRVAERTKREIVTQYLKLGREVRVIEGSIVDITRGKWGQIRGLITSETEIARQEGRRAFTDLQRAAVDALRNMGYGPKEARGIISGMDADASRTGKWASQAALKSGPGTVDAGIAAGTRAGPPKPPGVGDAWGADSASRGKNPGGSATGSASLMGAKPGLGIYAQDAKGFGLSVSSGLRPGSITNAGNVSYHSSGDAIDVAGPPAAMMAFAKHAASTYGSRLEELIYTPLGFSIKNGQQVAPYAQKDHLDHVHLADKQAGALSGGGAGGGVGGLMGNNTSGGNVKLKRKGSKARGPLGAASAALEDIIATGMERRINAAGAGAVSGPAGAGTMAFDAVARLAESVGLPGITFAQIARGESSLNPRAVGNDPGGTQGLGLWQITTKFNDDIIKALGGRNAMFNPTINAQAAKMIYDRQGIGAWYGTKFVTDPNAHFQGDGWGGRAPEWGGWHQKGVDMTVHRPTMIGVGEGGAERVTVTPASKSGRGGKRVIQVSIGKIVNYEEGDIQKIVEREFAAIAADLDHGLEEDELD